MDNFMEGKFGNRLNRRLVSGSVAWSAFCFGRQGLKRVEKRLGFSQKSRLFFGKFPGFNVIFPKISGYFFLQKSSNPV